MAKKSLGQHFLTNLHTARRICDHISPEIQTVIEVGPGRGVLTQFLAERHGSLIMVEKDNDLAQSLSEAYGQTPGIKVVHADILRFRPEDHTSDRGVCLAGNFPYNISSQIVIKMLEYRDVVAEMVGMFQLEVARRIVASPGSKEYGVISVLAQASYEGRVVMTVGPGQFNPPPKVKSGVIKLVRKVDHEPPCDYRLFRLVVKQAFNQRRKMMRNTLKNIVPADILASNTIFNKRPEQIAVDEFFTIAQWAKFPNQSTQ